MGHEHGKEKPCKGNKHVLEQLTCTNPNCGDRKTICRNRHCGYPSMKNVERFLCRLCWVAEKSELEFTEEEKRDLGKKADIKVMASVSFDRENNRFNYDDFFTYVQMEDSERERVKKNFNMAAKNIPTHSDSMDFTSEEDKSGVGISEEGNLIRPVPRTTMPAAGGQDPLSNYVEVRKMSDSEFTVVHKTDASKNIDARIQMENNQAFEWVGLP